MSASAVLVCDLCGRLFSLTPPESTAPTRLRAKEEGWVYWKRGVDYCGACIHEVKAARLREASREPGGYL